MNRRDFLARVLGVGAAVVLPSPRAFARPAYICVDPATLLEPYQPTDSLGIGRLMIPGGFGPKASYRARDKFLRLLVSQWQLRGGNWDEIYADYLGNSYGSAEQALRIAMLPD